MFNTTKRYPYSPSDLEYLTNKTCTFLITQFHEVFDLYKKNITSITSAPPLKKRRKNKITKYKFITLGDQGLSCLPAAYHTAHPPVPDACDHCHKKLSLCNDGEGMVLICGHGYHRDCYVQMEMKCRHCMEYFKRGITDNVESFVKCLNAGDGFTMEAEWDEHATEEPEDLAAITLEADRDADLVSELGTMINDIETW
jgi:hypothetical protein